MAHKVLVAGVGMITFTKPGANFHIIFVIDPNKPEEFAEAKRLNKGGTCTGEHGIGMGKIDALYSELGNAVDLMQAIKRALDPQNVMNPGKIFKGYAS